MKKIYIDADSLLYRAAHLTNHKDDSLDEAMAIADEDDGEDLGLDTAEDTDALDSMKSIFHSMVKEMVEEVEHDAEAKGYEVDLNPIYVLTVKPSLGICADLDDNFRYEVMESVLDEDVKGYKHSRKGMEVPEGLNDIYSYVFGLPNTLCYGAIEADDAVVYYGREGHIICALDKDVLGSLEYAYNYGKQEWVENTIAEINMFPYYQTIVGDSSDGLRGVFRIGDKGARKLLDGLGSAEDMWKAVLGAYASKNQTRQEAIATMRCVRMDQWTPETGLVYWKPPKRGEV